MASTLTKEDLALLGQTIVAALAKSGGPNRYNPVSNEAQRAEDSPAARAEAIRRYKNTQNHNKILKDLTDINRRQLASSEELQTLLDYNTKSLAKVINSYDDVDKSQQALVKSLRDEMSRSSGPVAENFKLLAGKVDSLEDVLRVSDKSKNITDLAQAINGLAEGNNHVLQYMQSIENIKEDLKAQGKTLADFDSGLDTIDKKLRNLAINAGGKVDPHTGRVDTTDIAEQDMKFMAKVMRIHLRSDPGKQAIETANATATHANTIATRAHVTAQQRLTSITNVASDKLKHWAMRVTSATFVLDQLGHSAKFLYNQMMAAANTGTQRSFTEVIGNNVRALTSGIDPKVLQEIQAKNASVRSTMGRGEFDKSVTSPKDFLKVTGDRSEAAKIKAEVLSLMVGAGVRVNDATKSIGTMAKSMGKLQYLTGMTGEQLTKMTESIISDKDFQESMIGLNSQQRSAAIQNVQLMLEENRVRGISIEQSMQMIKDQKALTHGNKASSRLKAAAQIRSVGGILGIDTSLVAKATENRGGIESVIKKGMADGSIKNEQEAQQVRQKYNEQFKALKLGINNGQFDDNNRAMQLALESLENKMPEAGVIFQNPLDAQKMEANKIIGDAAKQYKEGAEISMGAAKLMQAANIGSTTWSNGLVGGFLQALVAQLFLKGLFRAGAGMLGGAASGAAGAAAAAGGASAAGAAAGAAGAAGAAAAGGGILSRVISYTGAAANTIRSVAGTALGAVARFAPASLVTAATTYGGAAINTLTGVAGSALNAVRSMLPVAAQSAQTGAATPGLLSRLASLIPASISGAAGTVAATVGKVLPSAPVIATLIGAAQVGMIAADGEKDTAQKVVASGEVVGSTAGAFGGWAGGAAGGAALGTMIFPGVGTAIGGVLGGLLGAYGGSKLGGWLGGEAGNGINKALDIKSPNQPAINSNTVNNTIQQPVSDSGSSVKSDSILLNKEPSKSEPVATGRVEDPNALLRVSIDQMSQILTNIYTVLAAQADANGNSVEKQIATQQRLARELKTATLASGMQQPASTAYNL